MAYASGSKAWGISDRSGRRYRLRTMKKEWTGSLVGPDEYEPKHPQLFPPRISPDPQAIQNARPDRVEPPVEVLLENNPFVLSSAYNSATISFQVIEPGTSRKTGDIVRFRDAPPVLHITAAFLNRAEGHTITANTADSFSIAVTDRPANSIARTYGNISIPIVEAVAALEPQATLFNVDIGGGRKLGDIDNNGSVYSQDSLQALKWETNIAIPVDQTTFIESEMTDYMTLTEERLAQYQAIGIEFIVRSAIDNERFGGSGVSAGPITVEA
jgi:hypothetical protein